MGSSLPYILYITLIVQHALLGASTAKQRNDNHHILFLLANVTPTNDFKGALLSCGFEAAAHAAAQVGYQVKVLTTDAQAWADKDASLFQEQNLPIEYVGLEPAKLVEKTPLESWYTSGAWMQHSSPYQDLSNAMRVAAVYKYGGLYLDSDIIMTSTAMTNLPAFVAKQDEEVVNNHIFRFPAGHAFTWMWMQRWMEECTAEHVYAKCGPGVLHPLFHERCIEATWSNLCAPMLPHNYTTPYPWDQITGMVAPNTDDHYDALHTDLYGVHWFSTPLIKWSQQNCTLETSFLHAVARNHCPVTLLHNYDALICDVYRVTPRPRSLADIAAYAKPLS